MPQNTVFIIDADQYPLDQYFNHNDFKDNHLITASNCNEKLTINYTNIRKNKLAKSIFAENVQTLSESADAVLVGAFFKFLDKNKVDKIYIATRDKKLLQMLLGLSQMKSNAKAFLHPCCRDDIYTDLSEFDCLSKNHNCLSQKRPFSAQLSNAERNVLEHLAQYPNGLKIKTLSSHYDVPQERIKSIINKLLQARFIEKYINSYFATARYFR